MSDNSSETQKDNLILPTFIIMLIDVADLIFEKMSPMDLSTLLRTAVDKFGIRFDEIEFRTEGEYISLYFDETIIRYSKNEDGDPTVTHKGQKVVIENGNFVEMAFNDMKTVIKSKYIMLSLFQYEEESYSKFNVFTTIIAWLESEKCVRVDHIRLSGFTFDEVLTILSYLDAKRLQVVHLCDEDELEQFEKMTEHLFHIKSFKIKVDEFSVQNAIKIRDDLMKRSTFNSCEIRFDASKIHRNDIASVFDSNSNRRYPWRFKYSNDDDRFWIRITAHDEFNKYTLNVKRIEHLKMQHNNLILPISPNLPLDLMAKNLDHMDRNSPQKSNNCSKMQVKSVCQPSMLNLPLDVADLVFEKMKRVDLLRTRKVCRGFRAAVDHFGVHFDTIDFTMKDDRIEINLDKEFRITYYNRKAVIKIGNFVEMALNDLKMLLKHVSNLEIRNETEERDDMMITSFLDFLEKEECIHVKEISFEHISYDDVIAMLKYCDAQTLKDIQVWCGSSSPDGIEALFELDQWKVLKSFQSFDGFFNGELLHHLFHLEKFEIIYSDFPDEDIVQMRDDLLKRSTFKKCRIEFRNYYGEKSEVLKFGTAKVFKPDIDSNELFQFSFEYSNENGRFRIDITGDDGYSPSLIVTRL